MKRRVFVAIGISPDLQAKIVAWETKYEYLPVRWLLGRNLHVTLVPPWYEEDVESVKSAMKAVRGIAPFEISFQNVSYGPDPRRPRLIWAEGETPPGIEELKAGAEEAVKQESEKRPFRLHLTLARFREEDFARFPLKWLGEQVSWREDVRSFVLMESHLSREGADYEVLEEFAFEP